MLHERFVHQLAELSSETGRDAHPQQEGTDGFSQSTLNFVIDGGGATGTTRLKGFLEVRQGCSIDSWG